MGDPACGCDVPALEPPEANSAKATATVEFEVEGIGCRNCANRVENALVQVEGVAEAHVTLEPPVATVSYDPQQASLEDLRAAVARAGAETHHEYRAGHLLYAADGKLE
ncbi:MAG: heavy-metal-associated domain-containing protein [Gemmatimonadetes bacterium]|nr:heavy-metal-associated domain-containing protein [Gemmatimonadota bacterium]